MAPALPPGVYRVYATVREAEGTFAVETGRATVAAYWGNATEAKERVTVRASSGGRGGEEVIEAAGQQPDGERTERKVVACTQRHCQAAAGKILPADTASRCAGRRRRVGSLRDPSSA